MITSLEEALKIGEAAKDYARSIIVKGTTHLDNNELDQARRLFLKKGMEDIRAGNHKDFSYLYRHEHVIHHAYKYSLGNCYELSHLALHYTVMNKEIDSNFSAAIAKIYGGDHVFLALNMSPILGKSESPMSWGNAAVICDPWANAVYKASDYLEKLKNYYFFHGRNHIEPFNRTIHSIILCEKYNLTYLRMAKEKDRELKQPIEQLKLIRKEMKNEKNKRLMQDEKNDPIVLVLQKKLLAINNAIEQIKKNGDDFASANEYCRDISLFDYFLNKNNEVANAAMIFSEKDKALLRTKNLMPSFFRKEIKEKKAETFTDKMIMLFKRH